MTQRTTSRTERGRRVLRRPRSALAQTLIASLRPTGLRRVGVLESSVVLVLAVASAWARIGPPAWNGVVWAEDGAVFLQGAHDRAPFAVVLEPYAGYAHVTPRVLAEMISWLPLGWEGRATVLVAALATGLMALFAYHVLSAHSRRRLAPAVGAIAVAAVPVGPEALDSLANLQWFLLAVGPLSVMWAPRDRAGRIASCVVIFLLATSCPFGGVTAALAVAVALVDRARTTAGLAAVGTVGVAIQLVVMAGAPAREGLRSSLDPVELGSGWLRRAVGDGFLGTARFDGRPSPSITAGMVIAVLVLVLAVSVVRARPAGRGAVPTVSVLAAPALLISVSFLTFAAPVVVSGVSTGYPLLPGRYFLAPAVLVVFAVALLMSSLVQTPLRSSGVVGRLVAAALLCGLVYGVATSWWMPESFGRADGPSWSGQVERAVQRCGDRPDRAVFRIAIAPEGWSVRLTCAATR